MNASLNQIEVAATIISRLAVSGGEGVDPEARLAYWRETEGLDGVEMWAAQSADETLVEIRQIIEEDGGFSLDQFGEVLVRDTMLALQVGWLAARRYEKRLRDEAEAQPSAD